MFSTVKKYKQESYILFMFIVHYILILVQILLMVIRLRLCQPKK